MTPPMQAAAAFLPFGSAPPPRASRRSAARFRPSPGWHIVTARGGPVHFCVVRLTIPYFRYIDGPRWAARIIPSGSTQCLPFGEAAELLSVGAAEQIMKGTRP